jgi:DNA topoisomerase VI subunit B
MNLKANPSVIDAIIRAIAWKSKCQNDEAAKALLMVLYYSMKILYLCCCKARSSLWNSPKVMDEVSVEVMLHEASVNWSNGHFFSSSQAVSWKKFCCF